MKKMVIGIAPAVIKSEDNPYGFKYVFLNSYSKKIFKNNAIAFGLLQSDENISEDSLNLCDGFLFPGGKKLEKAHFDIILHALKYNKPILGICLGMQVLNYFSCLKNILEQKNLEINKTNLWKIYNEIKNEEFFKLKDIPIPNIHGYEIMLNKVKCNYTTLEKSKHDIIINKDSILYKIYNKESLNVLSLHLKQIRNVGNDFKICAKAKDGVIEGIEYNDKNYFILGVQYHPELNDDNIFKYFIKEVEKRHV